jgi:hypothetical protein
MKKLQNPVTLGETPSKTQFQVPKYDWRNQTRHITSLAGRYTGNSLQTFDSKGQPKDSRSDNND